MIISPLNYAGNKAKVLKNLINLFPSNIDLFVDVFAGSGIVAFNSNVPKILCNDIDPHAIELVKYLYFNNSEDILESMDNIIKKYGLTDSTCQENKYIEKKHEGLSEYNKLPYNKLKQDYNKTKDTNLLFALVIFGFNHYLRFNSKNEYNIPVGKVDFSESLRRKTVDFVNEAKKYDATFKIGSYLESDLYSLCTNRSLVYFDPPYSITTAPYNSKWSSKDDENLFQLFDALTAKGIRVAMSNIFLSNGKENSFLIEWSKKYNVFTIVRQYRNANYQKKNITDSIEVLITNYKE